MKFIKTFRIKAKNLFFEEIAPHDYLRFTKKIVISILSNKQFII